jgi:hypothetical protein
MLRCPYRLDVSLRYIRTIGGKDGGSQAVSVRCRALLGGAAAGRASGVGAQRDDTAY